jgi:hypothetical protein
MMGTPPRPVSPCRSSVAMEVSKTEGHRDICGLPRHQAFTSTGVVYGVADAAVTDLLVAGRVGVT